jgi:hypothetical protein
LEEGNENLVCSSGVFVNYPRLGHVQAVVEIVLASPRNGSVLLHVGVFL